MRRRELPSGGNIRNVGAAHPNMGNRPRCPAAPPSLQFLASADVHRTPSAYDRAPSVHAWAARALHRVLLGAVDRDPTVLPAPLQQRGGARKLLLNPSPFEGAFMPPYLLDPLAHVVPALPTGRHPD